MINHISLPHTIRSTSFIAIAGLIILLLMAAATLVGYLTSDLPGRLVVAFLVMCGGLCAWTWRYRLVLSEEGITLLSLRARQLNWEDISAVSTTVELYGTGGSRNMHIHSGNPSKGPLKFYYTQFPRQELHLLLQIIRVRSQGVRFDKGVEDLLKRSDKAFHHHYPAA